MPTSARQFAVLSPLSFIRRVVGSRGVGKGGMLVVAVGRQSDTQQSNTSSIVKDVNALFVMAESGIKF